MSKRRPRGYQVRRVICSCGQEVPRDQLGRHIEREHRGKIVRLGELPPLANGDELTLTTSVDLGAPDLDTPAGHTLPPKPCPVCAADNVT